MTPVIPGGTTTLMARNMSVKTKANSGNDTAHTWGTDRQDCAISSGRLGDLLLELRKRKSGLFGMQDWLLDLCNAQSRLAYLVL